MLIPVDGVFFDQRYSGSGNPAGRPLFAPHKAPLAVEEAGRMLLEADRNLRSDGLAILVWDAWRPFAAQEAMWAVCPDERFVARPSRGPDGTPLSFGDHQRGCAFDATLATADGMEMSLPTDFDDFKSPLASPLASGSGSRFFLRDRLVRAMLGAGFVVSPDEWWHFFHPESFRFPPVFWLPEGFGS